MRHQQLCHMHLKQQQVIFYFFIFFRLCMCAYPLPAAATLPDPSTLQHEAAAIHLSLSGPCELPPPAAALQPARSHLLLRCGAARAEEEH